MPKFFCNLSDPDYPFPYCTNFAASIAFSVIFGITTLLHLGQAIYFKERFCWVIVMAGTWGMASYILRALSRYDISTEGFGIPSQLLVQLAPLWINAFVYMVFGRVVYYFIPDKRVGHLGARKLSLIFVLLDVLSFLVQGGSAIVAQSAEVNPDLKQTGFHVYQGGVGVQQLFIVLFIGLTKRCQVKLKATDGQQYRETSWRKALFPLYGALVLITIRIIYRLTEFAGGFDSGIANKEAPFYVLEATPMSRVPEEPEEKKSKSKGIVSEHIVLSDVQPSHDPERATSPSPSHEDTTAWAAGIAAVAEPVAHNYGGGYYYSGQEQAAWLK